MTGGRDEEYSWLPSLDDYTCLEILEQACKDVAAARGVSFKMGLDVGAADLWDQVARDPLPRPIGATLESQV